MYCILPVMTNKLHHYLFYYETETVGHVNLLVWCGFLVCDDLLCLSCSPNFKLLIAQLTSKTGRADKPQPRPLQELFWQPGVYQGLIWESCFVFFYNMWLGVVHGSQISPPCEWLSMTLHFSLWLHNGGTAAAVPPPFRPSEPALCGSCPLLTPYCCRLGDLLCLFV